VLRDDGIVIAVVISGKPDLQSASKVRQICPDLNVLGNHKQRADAG